MNKENLQKQIEEMKTKLANMEAELNKPEVIINYWQPEETNRYYYVNYLGLIGSASYTKNYHKDKLRYRVFKTQKEAEKYAEYVKAEETLRRVIAETNAEVDLSWDNMENWNNYEYIGYEVHLDRTNNTLHVGRFAHTKMFPNFMYIKSRELAEKLMKEYEAEFITYLSY